MTSIGAFNSISGSAIPSIGAIGSGTGDSRQVARETIGEIGHRVLAWVGASGGQGDRAAFAAETGVHSDYAADVRTLSRGGDIYGLGSIAADLTARYGGTPAEEGGLLRSLEGFTREAVVQIAGLSGAPADRQFEGIRDALMAIATAPADAGGLDGVARELDTAAAALARQNGG